jgi:ribosomal protein S18 acetylase RimI-like enzyme
MKSHRVIYRENITPDDCEHVRQVIASTGFFSEAELAIAVELVQERLIKGLSSGYEFVFAEQDNTVVGYTCFGPIAGTSVSYHVYWVAVHQKMRGNGIGKTLLDKAEHCITAQGGQRIYTETSSRRQYAPTRVFYKRCGYHREAMLKDFYAPGDGKVIYVKMIKKASSSESYVWDRQIPQFFLQRRGNYDWICKGGMNL